MFILLLIKNVIIMRPKNGMFCYEDRTFSKKLAENLNVCGVVGYVGVHRALVIGLDEAVLPWSSDDFDVEHAKKEILKNQPKENRHKLVTTAWLLEEAKRQGKKAEAMSWCFELCKNSIKRGEMFLPKFELLKIGMKDKEAIDASLIQLGLPKLSGRYWSASEANRNKAWCLEPQIGGEDYCNKTDALKVRPMFWVHF